MIVEYRDICFCERDGIGPHWPREGCPDDKVQTATEREQKAAADERDGAGS